MLEIEIPAVMPDTHFDQRMRAGWFRSGTVMFKSSVLAIGDSIRGLVHIRLPLATDAPSRSRKRSLRKNRDRFRVEIGPARVDDERQRLYDLTKPRFIGPVATELTPLVFGESPDVFDTRECAVYDDTRLVALSYFDVGGDSLASQLGLHDPAYAKWGLGTYTMFEEIEYGKAAGIDYFYPGYVIPGLGQFDYKLRFDGLEVLEGEDWRPLSGAPAPIPKADEIVRAMSTLSAALEKEGLPVRTRVYGGCWVGYATESMGALFLRGMIHVQIPTVPANTSDDEILLIEYDPERQVFELVWGDIADDIDLMEGFDPLGELESVYELRALMRGETVISSGSATRVARAAKRWSGIE